MIGSRSWHSGTTQRQGVTRRWSVAVASTAILLVLSVTVLAVVLLTSGPHKTKRAMEPEIFAMKLEKMHSFVGAAEGLEMAMLGAGSKGVTRPTAPKKAAGTSLSKNPPVSLPQWPQAPQAPAAVPAPQPTRTHG